MIKEVLTFFSYLFYADIIGNLAIFYSPYSQNYPYAQLKIFLRLMFGMQFNYNFEGHKMSEKTCISGVTFSFNTCEIFIQNNNEEITTWNHENIYFCDNGG